MIDEGTDITELKSDTYIIISIFLLSVGLFLLIYLSWKTAIAIAIIQLAIFIFHKNKRGRLAEKLSIYENLIEKNYRRFK